MVMGFGKDEKATHIVVSSGMVMLRATVSISGLTAIGTKACGLCH